MAEVGWRVGDLVTLQRGTTYEGALVGKDGPALLGLGSIEPGGGFRATHFKTFGGACPTKIMVAPGELFVALKGATKDGSMVGSIARVPSWLQGGGRLTQDTARLDFRDEGRGHESYLYWMLRTPQYRAYCAGRITGSASASFSRDDFLDYRFPAPSPSRSRIVATLDALEDKIELNLRMAETLEGLARVAYAELQASRRDDWPVGSIADVARNPRDQVDPRQIDPATPYIGLEHMPRGRMVLGEWGQSADAASGKTAFQRNDILFGKLRPYFRKVGVVSTSGICSTDILVIRPRSLDDIGYVLAVAADPAFIEASNAASTGTRMPRTSWPDLVRYPLPMPPAPARAAFTQRVWPLIERVQVAVSESGTLGQVRDGLLPRLLSGDIEIAA